MGIAIIGTGWGTRVQVPAFRSAGLEVVALAGNDAAKTARIAGELGVALGSGDWREVVGRSDVDLVSIVTPPPLHREIALAALAAGKHVLCEKPTALSAAEAQEMVGAAQSHPGQLALIDHELRFLPALLEARRLIRLGAIGRARHVVSLVINGTRADPARGWDWWSDAERGGGLLGAVGSHQIDTLRFLLGVEVEAVAATLNTFIDARPAPEGPRVVSSDDAYSLRLRLSGAVHASLEGSMVARSDEPNSLTLYGDEGTLRFVGGRLLRAAPRQPFEDITPAHAYELPDGLSGDFPHGTVYLGHALRRYLAGEQAALAPAATFLDGLLVQQVLDAARRSSQQEGGYVPLPAT